MKNFMAELPVDCVYTILSLTSPRDVCRSASTCSELQLTASSDNVWESFLPLDYLDIISKSGLSSTIFGSMKELFLLLCNPLLIDFGRKIFVLDKNTGLKSFLLSAKELSIAWSDDPLYWSWKNDPESRLFNESVELRTTSWLEIHGEINIKRLSPNTTYGAYLIFKISRRSYGLETMPMETLVQIGDTPLCSNTVYMHQDDGKKQQMQRILYYNRTKILTSRLNQGTGESDRVQPGVRKDGWLEVELGHFLSGECTDDDKMVKMSFMEIKGCHLKAGLIIEGIEIRPIHRS